MVNKSQYRAKSAPRRPMSGVSNKENDKQARFLIKEAIKNVESKGSLDRLLAVRSDLSDLVSQIDKLVAQAMNQKETSKRENEDIESFIDFLSGICSSSKPWLVRLQDALSTSTFTSKNQIKGRSTPAPLKTKLTNKTESSQINLMVSQSFTNPSLAASKKYLESHSTPYPCKNTEGSLLTSKTDSLQLDLLVSPSPLVSWRADSCVVTDGGKQLFLLTPLQKSQHQFSKKIDVKDRVPIVEPVHEARFVGLSESVLPKKPLTKVPDVSVEKIHEKHDEITKPIHDLKVINQKRDVSATLDWFFSPPKTCVLMEPSDEKKLELSTPVEKKNRNADRCEKNLDGTPCNLYMSATCTKKGETTLKRELWTRFDAVSSSNLKISTEIFQKKDGKGFLDLLDELSS